MIFCFRYDNAGVGARIKSDRSGIASPFLAIIMPQIERGQEVVLKKNLEGLPAGEGVGEHVAVSEFECAARR
jgi:hypothetical protein